MCVKPQSHLFYFLAIHTFCISNTEAKLQMQNAVKSPTHIFLQGRHRVPVNQHQACVCTINPKCNSTWVGLAPVSFLQLSEEQPSSAGNEVCMGCTYGFWLLLADDLTPLRYDVRQCIYHRCGLAFLCMVIFVLPHTPTEQEACG